MIGNEYDAQYSTLSIAVFIPIISPFRFTSGHQLNHGSIAVLVFNNPT